MEKIKQVLNYIKLYTGCDEYTTKRIESLLIDLVETQKNVKVIYKTKEVYIQKNIKREDFKVWADRYLLDNDLTYEDVAQKNRRKNTIKMRTKFCIDAYIDGYGFSVIARYLKSHHTTILHTIKHSKQSMIIN